MHIKLRFLPSAINAPSLTGGEAPCIKSKIRTHVAIQQCPLSGDPKTDSKIRENWWSAGYGQREHHGILYRDMRVQDWYMEWINTGPWLELVNRYGPVVLQHSPEDPAAYEILLGAKISEE